MLKTVEKAKTMTMPKQPKYIKLLDLAQDLRMRQQALYGYIYRQNKKSKHVQIEMFHLPGQGRQIHIKSEDAEMLRAIFTNPEDYAERIVREQKK